MTVSHVITGLGEGGAEGALFRLLAEEVRTSSPVSHRVLSLTGPGVYAERLEGLGVPVVCADMPRGRLTPGGLRVVWRFLRSGRRADRQHLVQSWMYHADLVAALLAPAAGVRHRVWGIRHSSLGAASRSLRVVAGLCALLSRLPWFRPDAIISNSHRAVTVHRDLGYRGRFRVVPNGYDLSAFGPDRAGASALRSAWGVPDTAVLLGMVARYDPQKDHETLLAAFAQLKRSSQADLRIVLVGPGCEERNAALSARIRDLGLTGSVLRVGRRSDIAAVMSAIDIHVLSSAWGEAFPNVLAEAMACGTPCVATRVGDAERIVADCGWLVEAGNLQSLAGGMSRALAACLSGGAAWADLQARCREHIVQHYSLRAMAAGFRGLWSAIARRRVLLLAPSMRGGGAERVMSTLASFLDRERFEVSVALLRSEGPWLSNLEAAGVPVLDLRVARARYALLPVFRLLWVERPHTVLSTLGYLNLVLGLLAPVLPRRTRLLAREANTPSESLRGQAHPRLMAFLYRLLYRRFDTVVCQSEAMARDLVRNFGVPAARCRVVYNPVDAQALQLAAGPLRADPSDSVLRLLAVGRLVPQKGYDLLIEALAGLHRPWQLTILGEGPDRASLTALAHERGVADRVSMPGFAASPHAAMAASHALVLSSRYEGLPNVVLEAGCLGLPVVAFDCPGGTREIVVHGRSGLLVPCGDTGALCDALEGFDPAAWDAEWIVSHIAAGHSIPRIIAAYERLL